MLDWPETAGVDIREIRPAIFTVVCFVVNDEIITEAGTVIFVHSDGEFRFEGSEFFPPQVFRWGNQKALLFVVLLVHPIVRGLPSKRAVPDDYIVKLGFRYHYGV